MKSQIEPIMKPKKWNTSRLALYGAFGGLAYAVFNHAANWGVQPVTSTIGGLVGGAVGGAALIATVSGIRNLFIR